MRPVIERKFVFIGSVADRSITAVLMECTQREKDALLDRSLKTLGLIGASGRLGSRRFTLVGGGGIWLLNFEDREKQTRTKAVL